MKRWIPILALSGCMILDSLIFFPDRQMEATPAEVTERWIKTSDGETLHAWFIPPPDDEAPVLVWSHGNGGNISGRSDILLALANKGLGLLAYDYRGYGRSSGQPSEHGVYHDAQAAFDSIVADGVSPTRIVCFGDSLGGAVSIFLATVRSCRTVAVVSTFTSLKDVGRKHYGVLAAVVGDQFNSRSRISSIGVPLFVAHGDQDEIIPYSLGKQLFIAASEPKEFFEARGYHHNDVFSAPGLISAIARFAHHGLHS